MHRSGTSALAGALARLGVALGDRLLDGGEDNPDGYYEHREIVAVHDDLASQRGRTWDDPRPAAPDLHDDASRGALAATVRELVARDFAGSPVWALKDPRLCRFLPPWLDVLAADGIDARCLLVLRAPHEVAASLARRNGFTAEKSAALWLDHVLEAHRGSRGRPRARARFDELLDDPTATLARCGDELDVSWPRNPAEAADELGEFLRLDLRHHRDARWAPAPGTLAELAGEVWRELLASDAWPDAEAIDRWHRSYAERFGSVSSLILEHATQVAERAARDRAWATENSMHRELEPLLTDLERRIAERVSLLAQEVARHSEELVGQGDAISGLAEELARHSQELVKQGEAISALEQRATKLEEARAATPSRWLQRLLGRRD
jgi:hypothetical protein